jgi:DNA primase catalytic subunit
MASHYYAYHFPWSFVWSHYLQPGLRYALAVTIDIIIKRNERFKTHEDLTRFVQANAIPKKFVKTDMLECSIYFVQMENLRKYLISHDHLSVYFQYPKGITQAPLFLDWDIDKSIPRQCGVCSERDCCDYCWIHLVRPNLLKLYKWLTAFCGFSKIHIFFSGRRGFHMWIFDERPMGWTGEQREMFCYKSPVKLDTEVTRAFANNHLYRIPFSFHYATGYIVSPILDLEDFTPGKDGIKYAKADRDKLEYLASCLK